MGSTNYRDHGQAEEQLRGMLKEHDTAGLRFGDIQREALKHEPRNSLTDNWRLADDDELAAILQRLRERG
ncbi:hypothetical protein L332_04925 [Agrococcus pavilionensis RW1]|uniref:Uncharacterized protein n=1 Tax=Agrococcus pavilionensis RW1 TaxID=1330458 RepID=U1MPI1_9MICO|nr:hypothetical protein [Agrococcus pavilionensis]ERG63796.1 hypothetical protein L332_04925 [Agrococcus pavilionensis RW1]